MSGQLKEVRNRIESVKSTQQITKAMKMVSAAKLRRAQDAIMQMRPYAQKMQEMLSNIVSAESELSIQLAEERPINNVLLIVITSDRGLAGAYNSNIVKLAQSTIKQKYATQQAQGKVTIWNIGKKGWESMTKSKFKTVATYKDLLLDVSFSHVQQVAAQAVLEFEKGNFDVVEIIYSRFKNAATQIFTAEQFLPIPKTKNMSNREQKVDFIFEPQKEQLLTELMPKILNTQLYKAVLDATASEHGARMTAMDKASDNANEILRELKISYNRARQAAITTELTEIVSGAAALQG